MGQKEQRYVDSIQSGLSSDERELFELLHRYENSSILPEKDEASKTMLLRADIKSNLMDLLAKQPNISPRDAVMVLMNKLPSDSGFFAYHLVISVVSKYLPYTIVAGMR